MHTIGGDPFGHFTMGAQGFQIAQALRHGLCGIGRGLSRVVEHGQAGACQCACEATHPGGFLGRGAEAVQGAGEGLHLGNGQKGQHREQPDHHGKGNVDADGDRNFRE